MKIIVDLGKSNWWNSERGMKWQWKRSANWTWFKTCFECIIWKFYICTKIYMPYIHRSIIWTYVYIIYICTYIHFSKFVYCCKRKQRNGSIVKREYGLHTYIYLHRTMSLNSWKTSICNILPPDMFKKNPPTVLSGKTNYIGSKSGRCACICNLK